MREFRSYVAIHESFSVKFGAWHSLAWHKRAIRKSFLRENRIFHQSAKVFSLESFPLYGIGHRIHIGAERLITGLLLRVKLSTLPSFAWLNKARSHLT